MSSKSKRRVTVDTGNTVSEDSEKRKPSVFERLGPGAGQRKYSDYENAEREKKCRPFLLTGECPYGATCKYKHVQLSRKSKTKEDDTSPENLRLKLKGGEAARSGEKHRDSDTESHDMPGRAAGRSRRDKEGEATGHSRRDKETKIKSQVVVKKSGNQDSDDSGDDSESNWLNSLDYKKELELEQERQLLQRQLSQLAEAEDEVENITIQKKVPAAQSGSDSSPERGRPAKAPASPHEKRSTSPVGRGKKEKKKHRTRSPPETLAKERKVSPSAAEKPREHKKKHEAEEEGHKKHKKKKEKRRSLSPQPEVKAKKKDKGAEEQDIPAPRSHAESRQRSQTHAKRARSSSSDSSASPPRSKDGKDKTKVKGRKKKNRGGKGDAGSGSDDSPAKSKKWLSPLKKTLKLKKVKPSSSVADLKDDEERSKRRSLSPRRGDHPDLLAEDPMPPSRSHDSKRDWEAARPRGHSIEKRDKKHKGKRSESPAVLAADRTGRRGSRGQDASFDRKGRHSESPAMQAERGGSSKRGEGGRDPSYDRRKWEQDRDRKGAVEDRPKRGGTSPAPRQTEMYSPSQLDRDSPLPDSSSRAHLRGDAGRDDDRRGMGRDGRRGDKADPRTQTPPRPERAGAGAVQYSRRDGDNFDQFPQDRGRFDPERGRGESREGRGQDVGDRDSRGHRAEAFDRGVPARERGGRSDVPFDRRDNVRQAGGRDSSRDNEGRDRSRDARDRGDNRDVRGDREGRASGSESGKFGGGGNNFGGEGQRRGRQWEGSNKGGDWGGDRGDSARDLPGGRVEDRGGHVFREDARDAGRVGERRGRDIPVDRGDGRLERGDSRSDRGDNRLDRADSRSDRGEGRMDRGDVRLDRGVDRLERGDRSLDRADSRLDRGDRLDRGEARPDRGDGRMDRPRDPPLGAMDQRGPRQGQGRGGAAGPSEGRGGMRGADNRSPVDPRGFEYERRGGGPRDVPGDMGRGGRPGDREGRMDRERDREPPGPAPRDRFDPGPPDFRRDDRGFRENPPDVGRHGDARFMEPDVRDPQQRGGRRFDDVRDDRLPDRGQLDDRQGQGRMLPRGVGGGMYDYDRPPGPDVRPQDPLLNQRRGPLLPTPVEEPPPPRRGGRGDVYERDLPRPGRDAGRDMRDERGGRRDQREADFPPDLGPRDDRGRRDARDAADFPQDFRQAGREFPRDGPRDPVWGRDGRDMGRDVPRDIAVRRGRGTPAEEPPPDMMDRPRDRGGRPDLPLPRRDRDRSPRREAEKGKDGPPPDLDPAKRQRDDDRGREGPGRLETSDARSTRSADDLRDGQRLKDKVPEAPAKASSLRGGRDRDSQSDGKRSPGYSRGQDKSPLDFPERRPPVKRTRSLSPKARRSTPLAERAPPGSDGGRSPAPTRSPGRRGADPTLSPQTKTDRRARSRTPIGVKRKLDEELRSPAARARDDAKSPATKRPREESRSPGRRGSRHPSPAGSHHSRGSHSSSMEPRKRPGSAHREGEGRFFGHGRDSPAAWKDRDAAAKVEKPGDVSKGEADRGDMSRKRGRSPPRSQGRGPDSAEKGRKRWKGDSTLSDTDGDGTEKDGARQKPVSGEQDRAPDTPGNAADTGRADTTKTPPAFPAPAGGTPSGDAGKSGRQARDNSFASHGNEEWAGSELNRSETRAGVTAEGETQGDVSGGGDNADDSKDGGLGNMLDDYEKISSDESDFDPDEEEKQSQNIVSVLDIDWASLAKEATPKQTTGSLHKRFHPATIFSEIGISRSLAGPALFDKVKALCEEGVKVPEPEEKSDGKENKDSTSTKAESGPKTAPTPKMDTSLLADVPVMHLAAARQKRERGNLLRNLGPFRRALCARRDLEIRRQLCKVDKVYEHPAVFPAHVMDTDLCKLSIQLFRQGRDFVDRKDSECDGKVELSV